MWDRAGCRVENGLWEGKSRCPQGTKRALPELRGPRFMHPRWGSHWEVKGSRSALKFRQARRPSSRGPNAQQASSLRAFAQASPRLPYPHLPLPLLLPPWDYLSDPGL